MIHIFAIFSFTMNWVLLWFNKLLIDDLRTFLMLSMNEHDKLLAQIAEKNQVIHDLLEKNNISVVEDVQLVGELAPIAEAA